MFESLRVVTLCPHAFRLQAPSKLLPEAPAWDCGELPSSHQTCSVKLCHWKPFETATSVSIPLAGNFQRQIYHHARGLHHLNFAWCCAHILGIRTPGGNLPVCEGDQQTGTIKNPRKIWLILIAFTCYNVVSEACDQHHCLSVAFVNGSQSQFPLDFFAGQCCFLRIAQYLCSRSGPSPQESVPTFYIEGLEMSRACHRFAAMWLSSREGQETKHLLSAPAQKLVICTMTAETLQTAYSIISYFAHFQFPGFCNILLDVFLTTNAWCGSRTLHSICRTSSNKLKEINWKPLSAKGPRNNWNNNNGVGPCSWLSWLLWL